MRSQLTAGSDVYALTGHRQLIGQVNEHDHERDEHHPAGAAREHAARRSDEPPAEHDATTETTSS